MAGCLFAEGAGACSDYIAIAQGSLAAQMLTPCAEPLEATSQLQHPGWNLHPSSPLHLHVHVPSIPSGFWIRPGLHNDAHR